MNSNAMAVRPLVAAVTAWLLAAAGLAMAQGAGGALATGDAVAGEDLFLDHCAICHLPEGGGQGPSLNGLYGRKAGSVAGFAYSAAVRDSGLTWTGPELDRFLTNPIKALPGTAMPILVADPKDRADLIAYFASRSRP